MFIQLGTCSWTDKPLIDSGRFYPAAARTPEARLRFYASVFPTVGVDSSYYALPSHANAARWIERTPASFTFHVKAFRSSRVTGPTSARCRRTSAPRRRRMPTAMGAST
ncbi:MAG: DUF72 domain-containing protein [SAR202 cluster bacterium]|nr:DUF72 domain-containing protein [SAR202 cluster bacterium]